jgi:hypothetical protein
MVVLQREIFTLKKDALSGTSTEYMRILRSGGVSHRHNTACTSPYTPLLGCGIAPSAAAKVMKGDHSYSVSAILSHVSTYIGRSSSPMLTKSCSTPITDRRHCQETHLHSIDVGWPEEEAIYEERLCGQRLWVPVASSKEKADPSCAGKRTPEPESRSCASAYHDCIGC